MADRTWVVTAVGGAAPGLGKALRDAGLKVDQELSEIGVFIGRHSDAGADRLRKLKGVSDVSPETPIDIGAPGDDETW